MALSSCAFMHDDEVIAVAEGDKLFKKDVVALLPDGLSSADSMEMCARIIDDWALGRVLDKRIDRELSEQEKDISGEIEDYRSSLLRFRFEQHYMERRLDTIVTGTQVQEYFQANSQDFALKNTIVRLRVFKLPPKSRERDEVRRMLKDFSEDDEAELKALGQRPACSYDDFGGAWKTFAELSAHYGTELSPFLSGKGSGSLASVSDEQSEELVIYLADVVEAGKIPPPEYCSGQIKEIILSNRRHSLSRNFRQDILREAADCGEFEVYDGKK